MVSWTPLPLPLNDPENAYRTILQKLPRIPPNAIITALESRIVREIEDAGGGLAAEERAEKLERLRGELLAAELDEERLIQQSERSGAPIARRGDASPEVVLGLADQPERRAA